jgi:hypothetical protein
VLSAAVIAALITAAINLWLARRKSREEERARIRNALAEAFQAYASYKEFPYAVRRRRHDQPAEERIRLSEALREVQARLTYFEAWTKTETQTWVPPTPPWSLNSAGSLAARSGKHGWTHPAPKTPA